MIVGSAGRVAGSRMESRWGYSALRCPLRVSIQAWSVGVAGRAKCWAIAHMAMNSRVEPGVIWGPFVADGEQDRSGLVIDARVDPCVVVPGLEQVEQALGGQGVGEGELDLGGGLLSRDDLGEPLAGDQVLDDGHRHPGPGEVGRVVDPDRVGLVLGPSPGTACAVTDPGV